MVRIWYSASPLLADDERELLQSGGGQVHVEVHDHVRQLGEVKLDAVEHAALVRVLTRQVYSKRENRKETPSTNDTTKSGQPSTPWTPPTE